VSAASRATLAAFLAFAVPISGASARPYKVVDAQLSYDGRISRPMVTFRFAPESARDFARSTEANVGRKIDIRVDGKTLLTTTIREPISGDTGQVPVASVEEGRALAARLSDGSAILEIEVRRD
jgi:preprotein translocase subunit SecD